MKLAFAIGFAAACVFFHRAYGSACAVSSECPAAKACDFRLRICYDPCSMACGMRAKCEVINHNPVCSCPAGLFGDPFIACSIVWAMWNQDNVQTYTAIKRKTIYDLIFWNSDTPQIVIAKLSSVNLDLSTLDAKGKVLGFMLYNEGDWSKYSLQNLWFLDWVACNEGD